MKEKDIDIEVIKFKTKEDAQNASTPFTTYSLFYKNKFITHEILSKNKVEKLVKEL